MTKKSSRAPTLNLGQSNFSDSLNSPNTSGPFDTCIPFIFYRINVQSTDTGDAPPTPGLTAIPPFPSSPRDSTKHGRDTSKSFFTNFKASRSTHKINYSDNSIGRPGEEKPVSRGSSKDRTAHKTKGHNSPSPGLPKTSSSSGKSKGESFGDKSQSGQQSANGKANENSEQQQQLTTKKSKPRFANLLARSRSIRVDEPFSGGRPSATRRPSNGLLRLEEISREEAQASLKTAPLQPERSFNDAMGSTVRNRSADRPPVEERNNHSRRDRAHGGATVNSPFNQVTSSSLFNNLKQSSSGAADRLGEPGKGFLAKFTKTGYYLNFKGCEEEGLYRVPGSGKDIKHWQRRFDTELDINLFDEPELYDVNTIGSMFKAWLRELPDEIFPKATQAMIAEKCPGATKAPQLLKDELSKLPPFNYYLLFAITCHLSLLHSYVDKNKMDYRNLCICFQPCMKIDGFCFQFLVCDWKNCWQGCWTEKEYLEKELEHARQLKEAALNKTTPPAASATETAEERAISSSGSSHPMDHEASSGTTTKASSRSGSLKKGRKTPPNIGNDNLKVSSQLPELGPPLSPIEI
ncbi:conserved hypothetical protein [Uncinocarpus reesii 1704]|uniref:Rho-GAP domain-containing protein n=1 Tax=Uncinocarpus reesii (strain UAMH 1704) TaxID=336963 RepID=C4JZY5_UNCRE|nr:uncharacterized protein UREG_07736 [Uncinocarpus reesii 1704]EEP82871.1 conserved hypothetical protein [Uncinocarpus reesii 1704]